MTSITQGRIHTIQQYGAALSANVGAFAIGIVIGWTFPTENHVRDSKLKFPLNFAQFVWVNLATALGAACMCIPTGFLMDKLGRKLTILVFILPLTLGWCLLIWAQNVIWMYSGRFIMGLTVGAYCVAIPVYTCEIAHKQIRGILGSLFQLMMASGMLFVYVIGCCLNPFPLNVICGVTPFLFGIIFSFMPESPTYLIKKGKDEIAIKNLKWLHGENYDYMSEIDDLKKTDEESKNTASFLPKALLKRTALKALAINFGLMTFQQLCGINAVIFYAVIIFDDTNPNIGVFLSDVIVGIIIVLATFVAMLFMDYVGRRFLLLISAFVMSMSSLTLGFYFQNENEISKNKSISWLSITSLCSFLVSYSLGFGPIPWLMVTELFTSNIRSLATSLVITWNWILVFIFTKTFLDFKEVIGDGPILWLFSGLAILGAIFVLLCISETKCKSFNEIQQTLEGTQSIK